MSESLPPPADSHPPIAPAVPWTVRLSAAGAVTFAVGLLAWIFGWGPIGDMDTWLHLSMGRWMVENGQVMAQDPWTFTEPGARVIAHEWLFQILQYRIWQFLGPEGLAGFRVALVALMGTAVLLHGRSLRANPALVLVFLTVAFYIGASRLSDRPHLVTFAFVPLLAALLEGWRRSPSPARSLGVVALFWVWAQCHGGILYGLAVLGAFGADGLARSRGWLQTESDESAPPIPVWKWVMLGTLCLAATVIGPTGSGTLLYGPQTLGKLRGMGLQTLEFVRSGDGWLSWLVLGLMAAGTMTLIVVEGRRAPRYGLILAMLTLGSLGAVRDRAVWFLIAAAPLSVLLGRYLQTRPDDIRRTLTASLVGLAAVLALSVIPGKILSVARPGMAAILPDGPLEYLKKVRPGPTHVLTPDYLGSYLNWKSPGVAKPFLDARMEAWSRELLWDHTVAINDTSPTLRQEILDRRGVEALLLDYPGSTARLRMRPGLRLSAFETTGSWALIYWDDSAMLYLRRTLAEQRNLPILTQLNPANPALVFRALAVDFDATTGPVRTPRLDAVDQELRLVMKLAPNCSHAPRLLAHLLTLARRYSEAAPLWREAIVRADQRGAPIQINDYEAWIGTLTDASLTTEADAARAEFQARFPGR